MKQTYDGKIISGGDRIVSDPRDNPDKPIKDELNSNNKQFAENILPFLKDEDMVDTWTGLMPFTPDGKPLIGKIGVLSGGVYIISGLESSGLMMGPGAG